MCSSLGGYPNNNASVTFYTFAMGTQLVNCSYATHPGGPDRVDFVATGSGTYFAAMNTQDYDNAAMCGACIEVSRNDGRKVTVTVVDQCPIGTNPKCTAGHLDLSRAAFLQIGNESEGYLGTGNGGAVGQISWRYVACPTSGNVSMRLKEPSNANWNQILVENHKYAVKSVQVQVDGAWVSATRQSYNFFEPPGARFGAAPYRLRITDVNDQTIEEQISLSSGDQMGAHQFSCQ
jgi:expansin (peptidoglycan-binding protein)